MDRAQLAERDGGLRLKLEQTAVDEEGVSVKGERRMRWVAFAEHNELEMLWRWWPAERALTAAGGGAAAAAGAAAGQLRQPPGRCQASSARLLDGP